MISYERAKKIAISETIPDGKVYVGGEAKEFYYFIVVKKDFPDLPGMMTGATYTAVDKKDGGVWICSVTDPRLKDAEKVEGPKEKVGGSPSGFGN